MRKLLIVLAFASVSVVSFAQDDATLKHSVATNTFWKNWFIQVGGDYNMWFSDEEHGRNLDGSDHFGFFDSKRTSFGASIAIGKWFTPGIGLRTKAQAWKAKQVSKADPDDFDYWTLNEHVLFNLSNLLCGYNPNRVWNVIPFAGGGISRTMTHDLYAMQLSVGLLQEFRVSKRVAVNLELGWNRIEEDFDGTYGNLIDSKYNRGWEDKDNNLYAEVGLTFNIGTTGWNKVPDVDAINASWQTQLDALNAKLRDAQAENARLQQLLAECSNKPMPTSVKEFITTPVSVFFNLAKTNIANPKDLVNVRALAKFAKENNCDMLVTGYADSSTGTPEINERLSLERAETVKGELIGMGVAEDKISTAHNGGVKILGVDLPIEFDRRATVEITNVPEE